MQNFAQSLSNHIDKKTAIETAGLLGSVIASFFMLAVYMSIR